jgi:hypothetical protein
MAWHVNKGFAVIKVSGSLLSKKPRIQYKYIYYKKDTKNFRQLEDHIKRDIKGIIII